MPKKKGRRQQSWDEWYKLARAYWQAHGDLLVPRDYSCPAGQKLGRWIERQRAIYNGVSSVQGHLYPEQIMLLEEIDMAWKLEHRHPWSAWIDQLKRYKKIYGNIDVPGDFENRDYHLGNWITQQRKRRYAGKLTEQEISELDALGMVWNLASRPREWDEWYADAREYFLENGDLLVPANHRTAEGYLLGYWVYEQRRIRADCEAGKRLTEAQIEMLDAIHMVWDRESLRLEAWDRMYEWVSNYVKVHGRLPTRAAGAMAPDGRSMFGWIATQKATLAKGKLTGARREQLARIGIILPNEKPDARAASEAEEGTASNEARSA